MTNNYLHQSNDEIDYYKINMFRSDMKNLPFYELPTGYSLRRFQPNSNDNEIWAGIETAAGEFHTTQKAKEVFQKSYLEEPNARLLEERLFFLVNAEGRCIGTAIAGSGQTDGKAHGSLEWVSIIPEYQGRKLAKPLVSAVLKKIAEHSDRCFIDSQTTSWKAINMYADFGFIPAMNTEHSDRAWTLLGSICKRDFLSRNSSAT